MINRHCAIIFYIAVLLAFAACTSRPVSQTSEQVPNSDSLSVMPDVAAVAYIGYVDELQGTKELFTDVFFHESFDYDDFNEVTRLADSVIFQNDEIKCSRIKLAIAARYFDLSGLASLDLFDEDGNYVTKASISQVVYVEDQIEGFFVAMLEPVEKPGKQIAYCATHGKLPASRSVQWQLIDDPESSASMKKQFSKSSEPFSMRHYRTNDSTVFSVISDDTVATMVERSNQQMITLYSSPTSEFIGELLAVGECNTKPLLLARCSMPETDMTWTALFAFDGHTYHYIPRQRLPLIP